MNIEQLNELGIKADDLAAAIKRAVEQCGQLISEVKPVIKSYSTRLLDMAKIDTAIAEFINNNSGVEVSISTIADHIRDLTGYEVALYAIDESLSRLESTGVLELVSRSANGIAWKANNVPAKPYSNMFVVDELKTYMRETATPHSLASIRSYCKAKGWYTTDGIIYSAIGTLLAQKWIKVVPDRVEQHWVYIGSPCKRVEPTGARAKDVLNFIKANDKVSYTSIVAHTYKLGYQLKDIDVLYSKSSLELELDALECDGWITKTDYADGINVSSNLVYQYIHDTRSATAVVNVSEPQSVRNTVITYLNSVNSEVTQSDVVDHLKSKGIDLSLSYVEDLLKSIKSDDLSGSVVDYTYNYDSGVVKLSRIKYDFDDSGLGEISLDIAKKLINFMVDDKAYSESDLLTGLGLSRHNYLSFMRAALTYLNAKGYVSKDYERKVFVKGKITSISGTEMRKHVEDVRSLLDSTEFGYWNVTGIATKLRIPHKTVIDCIAILSKEVTVDVKQSGTGSPTDYCYKILKAKPDCTDKNNVVNWGVEVNSNNDFNVVQLPSVPDSIKDKINTTISTELKDKLTRDIFEFLYESDYGRKRGYTVDHILVFLRLNENMRIAVTSTLASMVDCGKLEYVHTGSMYRLPKLTHSVLNVLTSPHLIEQIIGRPITVAVAPHYTDAEANPANHNNVGTDK